MEDWLKQVENKPREDGGFSWWEECEFLGGNVSWVVRTG